MNKTEALKLIKAATEAAVTHYAVVNGSKRGAIHRAQDRESKAVKAVLRQMTDDPVTDADLEPYW